MTLAYLPTVLVSKCLDESEILVCPCSRVVFVAEDLAAKIVAGFVGEENGVFCVGELCVVRDSGVVRKRHRVRLCRGSGWS